LNHVGRVTAKTHRVVLEVAAQDADGSVVVASGWGPNAAWYRNILDNPDVSIQVGRRTIAATAVPLSHLRPAAPAADVGDFREVGRRMPLGPAMK